MTMGQITYRTATKDDIEIVTDLLFALYDGEGFDPVRDELLAENQEILAAKDHQLFLALDGDMAIGAAHGAIRLEYASSTIDDLKGYLEAIYVLPEYRKQGIAAELVKVTERWAAKNGCRKMASDCLLKNTASYDFHLKVGFEENERVILFIKDLEPYTYEICPVDENLREKIRPLTVGAWGSQMLAINGKLYDSQLMEGFAAVKDGEILGYLLYEFHRGVCEIMALQSIAQNIGIASALIERVKQLAKERGITTLIVQTSNDNMHAVRFYQRRGFTLREVRLNALEISRQVKPSIPLTGKDGIPLRDEIEFEMTLF